MRLNLVRSHSGCCCFQAPWRFLTLCSLSTGSVHAAGHRDGCRKVQLCCPGHAGALLARRGRCEDLQPNRWGPGLVEGREQRKGEPELAAGCPLEQQGLPRGCFQGGEDLVGWSLWACSSLGQHPLPIQLQMGLQGVQLYVGYLFKTFLCHRPPRQGPQTGQGKYASFCSPSATRQQKELQLLLPLGAQRSRLATSLQSELLERRPQAALCTSQPPPPCFGLAPGSFSPAVLLFSCLTCVSRVRCYSSRPPEGTGGSPFAAPHPLFVPPADWLVPFNLRGGGGHPMTAGSLEAVTPGRDSASCRNGCRLLRHHRTCWAWRAEAQAPGGPFSASRSSVKVCV